MVRLPLWLLFPVSAWAQFPPFPPGGGMPPQPNRDEIKLVEKFDANGDGVLSTEERRAASDYAATLRPKGGGERMRGFPGGPPGGPQNELPPAKPGRAVAPNQVRRYGAEKLYDERTLRTLFLTFENKESWEKELANFHDTDVEVPAQLVVDGRTYANVGVSMRGMSSFMHVGEGYKRSLSLSLDFVDKEQRLGGYHSLNLLNSHEDPTFMRAVLFNHLAREFVPAPQANFVRVVINGENWGLYVNQQPFNKEFTQEWFGSKKGVRWKVPGSPGARGGLEYTGDDVAEYRKHFEIKSKDDPAAWQRLINLCRVLNQTPPAELEAKLAPLLDLDEALRFLALDNAFINGDGYWTRASDYSMYEDVGGKFHLIPHDVNETFSLPGGGPPMGPRGPGSEARRGPPDSGGGMPGGGPRIKGVELDPLAKAGDSRMPLLSKLLAVPTLRARYLAYVRAMAAKWLDWQRLGPLVEQYRTLIEEDVKIDTRKLESTEAFAKNTSSFATSGSSEGSERQREIALRDFADRRRAYLLQNVKER